MNEIFCHSSERMPELADGTVTLTATSPPYWNAIDYDVHAQGRNAWHRTRAYAEGYDHYQEYLDWCTKIFSEVLRVTRPGGYCAVVVGTLLLKGRHYPVPFDLTARLVGSGWEFHQDIVWHKCTAGVKRAGVTIQKPFPGYYYPNIMTEYILIFRKPGPAIYKGLPVKKRVAGRISINRLFTMDIANNVWHIAPVPPRVLDHPCPFPEEIPHRLISLYSYPGELILDPFVGSGQTVKVAHQMGRSFVAYDIVAKYTKMAARRLSEPSALREEQLVVVFEKIPMDQACIGPGRNGKGRGPRRGPRKRPPSDQQTLFL